MSAINCKKNHKNIGCLYIWYIHSDLKKTRIYAVSSISVSPPNDNATRRKIANRMRSDAWHRIFSLFPVPRFGSSYLIWRRKAANSLPTSSRRRHLIGKQLAGTMSRRRGRWEWWGRRWRRKPNAE